MGIDRSNKPAWETPHYPDEGQFDQLVGANDNSPGSHARQRSVGEHHVVSGSRRDPARHQRGDSHEPHAHALRHRGPKSWQRPDSTIRGDLCDRLHQRPDIDCRDVTVEVRDGLVILEGFVPDRHMKYRIEDIAEVCPGVKEVDNRIGVRRCEARLR